MEFLPGLDPAQKAAVVYDWIPENFSERARQIRIFAPAPERLVITGSQSLLSELCHRKSEALGGIPTDPRPTPEATAHGAAQLAMGCKALQFTL